MMGVQPDVMPSAPTLDIPPKLQRDLEKCLQDISRPIINITITPNAQPETTPLLAKPGQITQIEEQAQKTTCPGYGAISPAISTSSQDTMIPFHPTLVTSTILSPIYLVLVLLPLAPFWIFTGFLTYLAATTTPNPALLAALAFLLPFNVVGTVAVMKFAMSERRKAVADVEAGVAVEAASGRRRSSGSEKQRLRGPSMVFVLRWG